MDLFFVLSAFLITSILSGEWRESGQLNLRRFYWRRFLRLMPPLALMLAVYLAVGPVLWPGYNHGRDAVLAGLYVSDYSYAFWRVPFYLRHTWSLAVEEHFYLIWPLLLVPLLRLRNPVPYLVVAYLASTLWRLSVEDWYQYYYRFDTRASGLVLGALLFFVLPKLRLSNWMPWAGLALLFLVFTTGEIRESRLTITIAELASAVLIASATTAQSGGLSTVLRSRPVVFVGRISYGIYLWHFPIAYALRDELPFVPTASIVLGTSIALASASYYSVEAWARRLKHRGSQSSGVAESFSETPLLSSQGVLR